MRAIRMSLRDVTSAMLEDAAGDPRSRPGAEGAARRRVRTIALSRRLGRGGWATSRTSAGSSMKATPRCATCSRSAAPSSTRLLRSPRRARRVRSRLTGAGFGGCTITLVRRESITRSHRGNRGAVPAAHRTEAAGFRGSAIAGRGGHRCQRLIPSSFGKSRTDAGTLCAAPGCSSRRIARGGHGRERVEPPPTLRRPPFDPSCYLCPGNVRANGERNPRYERHVRVHERLRRADTGHDRRDDPHRK